VPRIDEARVAGVLAALGLASELESGPTRMVGGRSADLFGFRLAAGPPDLIGRDLVLRVPPLRSGSLGECVIQRELARLDYPTPEVARSGVVEGIGPAMVMAHADGVSLFESLGPLRAFRRAPGALATLMLRLHRVDPSPVRSVLATIGSDDRDIEERALAEIDGGLETISHPDHAQLRAWLDRHRPPRERVVVCHGDLHALNVLVDGAEVAVVDWELAGIGDPAFDVARTKLLFKAVPMEISRAARPIVQRLGRRAAIRFENSYTSESPIAPPRLAWYEALHTARVIAIVLAHGSETGTNPVVDGWRPTLPLLLSLLRQLSGISLTH
jgi:aminoglycoside phosphotransferase (APT) family kinase protein